MKIEPSEREGSLMNFHLPEIGAWGEEKYKLVHNYAEIFSSSMKKKWECRVYVDLFSGAGRARVRDTGKVVDASPLIALQVANPFDKYIFCDQAAENIDALTSRVKCEHPEKDCEFICGDANACVDRILSAIPRGSASYKVLSFCFVDPFKIDNLKFNTLQRLTARYMDFLILVPTGMDAQRNAAVYYERSDNRCVEEFIGRPGWRAALKQSEMNSEKFSLFFFKQFCMSMAALGYNSNPEDSVDIRLPGKNFSLYRLAFFSKHTLARSFWGDVKKYSKPQLDLF